MTTRAHEIRTGLAWLHAADPVLAELIDDRPDLDPDVWLRRLPAMSLFGALVFQIIGQQISVTAATAIFERLTGRFGNRVPDPGELAAVDQATLRGFGMSWRKAAAILDLAQRFSDGRLSEAELRGLPDDEVISRLTAIKGIGPWTVQGALLIAWHRPDLIRTGDLALRHAIRVRYGLDHLPDPDEVADIARPWRPYRSLASSLLLAAASGLRNLGGTLSQRAARLSYRTSGRPSGRGRPPVSTDAVDAKRYTPRAGKTSAT
jgi:DNA-3-methyladenine glycosylase II